MLTSTTNKVQYTISYPFGSTFPVTIKYWLAAEIHAVLSFPVATGKIELPLVLNTDFSLTAPGDSGTLTRLNDWDHDAIRLTIYRLLEIDQQTDYRNGEAVDMDLLEQDFDRATARMQQIDERYDRTLVGPITDEEPLSEIPEAAVRASQFLGFDAEGDVLVGQPVGVPATTWAQTLLDDLNPSAAQTTLGISAFIKTLLDDLHGPMARTTLGAVGNDTPIILAAYDSPPIWQGSAYHIFTETEDVGYYIETLLSAEVRDILLAPGRFRWTTKITLPATQILRFRGCGSRATIIDLNEMYMAEPGLIELPSNFTGQFDCGDFFVDATNLQIPAVGTLILFRGYSAGAGRTRWTNILIDASGINTALGSLSCFTGLRNLSDIEIYITAGIMASEKTLAGFEECRDLVRCKLNVSALNPFDTDCALRGFYICSRLHDCEIVFSALSDEGDDYFVFGFANCDQLTNCNFYSDKSGPTLSDHMDGFINCTHLSCCSSRLSGSEGFYLCNYLSACLAFDCQAAGFQSCNYLSVCKAHLCVGSGFAGCEHVVASQATTNIINGFMSCRQCQQNYSVSNGGAQYSESYADQNTNACANTAAGGYNR
jgi:hypothetical protein